eukprot:gene6404-6635_t
MDQLPSNPPAHAERQASPIPGRKYLAGLLGALVNDAQRVSKLLIAVGLVGLLAVPVLERAINFDENALLAGSASPTIRSKTPEAYQVGKALAEALKPQYFAGHAFSAALQQQLAATLTDVELYNHSFPAGSRISRAGGNTTACVNVAAVLASSRGDGKESLLLVTPLRHQQYSPDYEQDDSGVALALAIGTALLYHLQQSAPWLAKDVIWLLPDASCGLVESVGAWAHYYNNPQAAELSQHQQHPQQHLPHHLQQHFGRAGVPQQAVVLEVPSGRLNTLQVSVEGFNGQLPKLDMYWLLR